MEIDGERILDRARRLAFPRYAGTEGCVRAQAMVAGWFRDAGLEVTEEPFSYDIRPAFRAIRGVLVSAAILVVVAASLAATSTAAALTALAAGIVVGGALIVYAPGAERIYRGEGPTRTANITGRRRVPGPRMTLIFLAHYDSKSQNLTFPWRNGLVIVAILGALSLLGVLVARLVAGGSAGPSWLPAATGGPACVALLVLSTLRSGNASPGGVDNAGSVAIVRELAEHLPSRLPADVETIFLSPSAEEDHMVGAMRWLAAHLDELRGRPVHALNFDGAGAPGRPVVLDSYGIFHRFAPEITRAAAAAARDLGLALRRIWMPPGIGVDAIPFHHRGVPCLTFSSGALDRATIAVHSRHDVAEHLDAATLEAVARLAAKTALRLVESDLATTHRGRESSGATRSAV